MIDRDEPLWTHFETILASDGGYVGIDELIPRDVPTARAVQSLRNWIVAHRGEVTTSSSFIGPLSADDLRWYDPRKQVHLRGISDFGPRMYLKDGIVLYRDGYSVRVLRWNRCQVSKECADELEAALTDAGGESEVPNVNPE